MGYRTLVLLQNDMQQVWQNDPMLGKKIAHASSGLFGGVIHTNFGYGQVVECVHADVQTLAVVDSYNYKAIAYDNWSTNKSSEETELRLLKAAAYKLGYRLSKIPDRN